MRTHSYLRAYMAGIALPTFILLIVMGIYAYYRYDFAVSSRFVVPLPGAPLDRAMLFPMAVVPNLWGAWNMLYLRLRDRSRWSLGVHGAVLPLVLVPAGFALARSLDVLDIGWLTAVPVVPLAMAIYFLVWKYLVAFLNRDLGID